MRMGGPIGSNEVGGNCLKEVCHKCGFKILQLLTSQSREKNSLQAECVPNDHSYLSFPPLPHCQPWMTTLLPLSFQWPPPSPSHFNDLLSLPLPSLILMPPLPLSPFHSNDPLPPPPLHTVNQLHQITTKYASHPLPLRTTFSPNSSSKQHTPHSITHSDLTVAIVQWSEPWQINQGPKVLTLSDCQRFIFIQLNMDCVLKSAQQHCRWTAHIAFFHPPVSKQNGEKLEAGGRPGSKAQRDREIPFVLSSWMQQPWGVYWCARVQMSVYSPR